MKTAEEFLPEHGLACEYGYNVDVVPYDDVIKAMKLYANQKLDEAKIIVQNHLSETGVSSFDIEKDIDSLKDKV